ncbi:cupin domain-containing protein [Chryseobacterium oranimense]|uniref:Cupin domain-containing protein n=1 Tax=Chryseobacterium oranimense TaxID=421058 RepID=A0A1M5K9I4_9FLAO|nr:hypothetical protein [Chryseobacterium oranimense]CEJ68705.1 hypothetical protein BN1195_00994 [Chryseobacterium oranimense G311]SHG49504.1 hypothetical protein SAMN05421866_0621 [Chryseobacterium oranimense]
MKMTRIFSDINGESHFEDIEIPLTDQGDIGFLSDDINVKKMQFRKVSAEYDYDFHHAPQRQYIVLLDGGVEIQTSLGEIRQFQTGEILLVEDISGKGHKTKNLEKKERTSIFIHL